MGSIHMHRKQFDMVRWNESRATTVFTHSDKSSFEELTVKGSSLLVTVLIINSDNNNDFCAWVVSLPTWHPLRSPLRIPGSQLADSSTRPPETGMRKRLTRFCAREHPCLTCEFRKNFAAICKAHHACRAPDGEGGAHGRLPWTFR